MRNIDICFLSVTEMVEAIKTKSLSPVEVMDAILSRVEQLNPRINAYCTLVIGTARVQAKEAEAMVMRGEHLEPLHGIPVSIKDLITTNGIRTTGGSKIYENFIPQTDAIVVERLKAAGAIIIGKTNTSEFGSTFFTDNKVFGPTRNPWNLNLTPGGSSGGAAASVASGMGPLAIGTDRAGSIRVPSSFCGTFGLKPSYGRVPRHPSDYVGAAMYFGPITRTVSDAALAMQVIAGRDDRDLSSLPDTNVRYVPFLDAGVRGLRIAWSKDLGFATVDRQVLDATEKAVRIFEALGCEIEADSPEDISQYRSIFSGVEYAALFLDKLEQRRDQMEPRFARRIEESKNVIALDYVRSQLKQLELWDRIRLFFEKYSLDLLLTPTVAVPPFELAKSEVTEIAGVEVSSQIGWTPFTSIFNKTGQPAASIPCGWTDDGLPIGLQIIGRRFDDLTVLKAAFAFEQASPWAGRRPPLD